MCKWNQLTSFIGSILWSVFPPIVPLILSYILCRKLMRIEAANETNRDVMLNNLLWNSFLKNSTHLPVCNLWTVIWGPCFCLPWSMTTHLTDDNLRHKEMLHFKLKFGAFHHLIVLGSWHCSNLFGRHCTWNLSFFRLFASRQLFLLNFVLFFNGL